MVNCVPDEVIPNRFFDERAQEEPEAIPDGVTGNSKMPPELATPPELKRGQILWIRGLTRLQTQVSRLFQSSLLGVRSRYNGLTAVFIIPTYPAWTHPLFS